MYMSWRSHTKKLLQQGLVAQQPTSLSRLETKDIVIIVMI